MGSTCPNREVIGLVGNKCLDIYAKREGMDDNRD